MVDQRIVTMLFKKKLYKLFKTNPIAVNESKYKKYKNKLNKLIRITEKEYYTSKFEFYTCSIKKTWQVIKNILSKNGTSSIAQ